MSGLEDHQACKECTLRCWRTHGNEMNEGLGSVPSPVCFFRIMLGNFSDALIIPSMFSTTLRDLLNQDAYLEDSSGHTWKVKVSMLDGSLVFGQGWRDFVLYHSIVVGEFVVFRYIGGTRFCTQIFATSSWERVDYVKSSRDALKRNRVEFENCHQDLNLGKTSGISPEEEHLPHDIPVKKRGADRANYFDSSVIGSVPSGVADKVAAEDRTIPKKPAQFTKSNREYGECRKGGFDMSCGDKHLGRTIMKLSEEIRTLNVPVNVEEEDTTDRFDASGIRLVRKRSVGEVAPEDKDIAKKSEHCDYGSRMLRPGFAANNSKAPKHPIDKSADNICSTGYRKAVHNVVHEDSEHEREAIAEIPGKKGLIVKNGKLSIPESHDKCSQAVRLVDHTKQKSTNKAAGVECVKGDTKYQLPEHEMLDRNMHCGETDAAGSFKFRNPSVICTEDIERHQTSLRGTFSKVLAVAEDGVCHIINDGLMKGVGAIRDTLIDFCACKEGDGMCRDGWQAMPAEASSLCEKDLEVPGTALKSNTCIPAKHNGCHMEGKMRERPVEFQEKVTSCPRGKTIQSVQMDSIRGTTIDFCASKKGNGVCRHGLEAMAGEASSLCQKNLEVPGTADKSNTCIPEKNNGRHMESKTHDRLEEFQEKDTPLLGEKVVESEQINSIDLAQPISFCFRVSLPVKFLPWLELPYNLLLLGRKHIGNLVVLLRDPSLRLWPVLYHEDREIAHFTCGWKEFAVANELQQGDLCEFELKLESGNMFQVQISKA